MKMGMELEFFVTKQGKLVFPADYGFEYDGYPLLGELRTQPHENPYALVGEMQGMIQETLASAKTHKLGIQIVPYLDVDAEIRRLALRRNELKKTAEASFNMYNAVHIPYEGRVYAGLHIHFSGWEKAHAINKCTLCGGAIHVEKAYNPLPMPAIISALDLHYASRIKNADRVRGEYEMKPPYGFEYRSLPADTPLWSLATKLAEIKSFIQ